MIDPKELRIGNLLQMEDSYFIVSEITKNGFNVEPAEHELNQNGFSYSTESVIRTIAITEELLIKAGFHKIHQYGRLDDKIVWTFLGEDIFQESNGKYYTISDYTIELKGFYHLQNLVFDLTGKELTL